MKLIPMLVAVGLVAGFSLDASAQDGKKRGEKRAEKRQALLKKFDKDGDGKLNKAERRDAHEFKAKRRAEDGRDRKGPAGACSASSTRTATTGSTARSGANCTSSGTIAASCVAARAFTTKYLCRSG